MRRLTTPSQQLDAIAAQHEDLRERIARCEQLADRLDAGSLDPSRLLDEVAALRRAFEEHNQFEERALSRVLRDADRLGALRVSRIVEDHIEEHHAIRRELTGGPTTELRTVLAGMREHLETEERYLLPPKAQRGDLAG